MSDASAARVLERRARTVGAALVPVAIALIVSIVLLWLADAPPLETIRLVVEGSLGSEVRIGDTLMVWVPIALAAVAVTVTFAAGLWNIGVEGQIVLGAIATSFVAREFGAPPVLLIPAMIAAGMFGGMAWGLLVGVLRVRGGVNEIFGGLGLDFVATGLVIYLVIGPWKREGVASTSGTDLFPRDAWFPTVADLRLSLLAVGIAIVAVIAVHLLMRGTSFGLRLRAVGRSPASAGRLGIPTDRYLLLAFLLAGAIAGLAGTVQAAAFHHKLVPAISGGYGFLGILIALLAGYRALGTAPIALFFAAIAVGSVQLQLRLDLDSSLGGVFQAVLVLIVLLSRGWQLRRATAGAG